jgi:exodeoxyribonuclease-5
MTVLRDDAARATAMAALDHSLLVEAGAGSGKTAVMAGRVALLLAAGVEPKAIAAVTFTELAAGELLQRVRAFVDALCAGRIPPELAVALPQGLSAAQRECLVHSASLIDELTCSTIHGFCQQLILPYPVEAGIDPGASVMDGQQAEQAFNDLADRWLWKALDSRADGLLANLVADEPARTICFVRSVLGQMRIQRELVTPAPQPIDRLIDQFTASVAALTEFVRTTPAHEGETDLRARCFAEITAEVDRARALPENQALARLLLCEPHGELCTQAGEFKSYRTKGKWRTAARDAGLGQARGDVLFEQAEPLLAACCSSWTELKQQVAVAGLRQMVNELRPVLSRFQDYKRDRALLDFDDLIYSARQLLRDHDTIRQALGTRFRHVLVDEFQDTDRLQSEIFWRLCGDPPADAAQGDWAAFRIRPGALFLVGDPKQAIYRFRGADIQAYQAARHIFHRHDGVLSIATNFRSCEPILDFVNARFDGRLSEDGQPGFIALDPFHSAEADQMCVAALDVAAAGKDGKASAEQQRDAEADAVAAICDNLIGRLTVTERGGVRPCRAGDIALLAPTGSGLWRYEEALERRGIAVATQAGKGFYRRQEVQDMIALSRVIADSRDTIALGALLRGPLVGLTEEELLDIVVSLPANPGGNQVNQRLTVNVDPAAVNNEHAGAVIAQLQALRKQVNSTTPHLLLSQAVDVFRVRPILLQRYRGRAERALANIDKFLAMSQSYSVQGMAAFAAAMTLAWTDEARAPEGQPDAQEDAVTLYTMHAAKGLEWPVVVPVNTMTLTQSADSMFCERVANRLCCQVFGVALPGYDSDRDTEKRELERERVRLWYVAATRARELLVLPRLDVAAAQNAWSALLNLGLDDLPPVPVLPGAAVTMPAAPEVNAQTREVFHAEAAKVADAAREIRWRTPSRDEGGSGAVMAEETIAARVEAAEQEADAPVQGGRERGLIMHKLFEEVLTGECSDDLASLELRAAELAGQLVAPERAAVLMLRPAEIADCVVRTLRLPEIAPLRERLVPECWVYGHAHGVDSDEVVIGIADAIAVANNGRPETVLDWKSDVEPTAEILLHYQAQLSSYLAVTRAQRGLIVLATSGRVIQVERDAAR